ncbi:MAG: hypothetical protein AVDCRST_MAG69-509 [uncultured Solirubrobacteraceae bacterium]|uniref:GGDEF domain-containing protein n=1 Tax=uncultured Solirubrobacteraceae bacterium TaxID=1162706 RepID=A0A6J4RR73_9ACTN|nr:MAG: hypothetical protein AVDCRST_MAG69-509 [uncultured Solirubrobacteraceae bacterium]
MRAGFLVVLLWLGMHEVRAVGFPDSADGVLFHRFAHLAVLGFSALSCLAAAGRSDGERLPWALIGSGLLAWTAGEAWYTIVLWDDPSPPIPSPADAGYQLFTLLLLSGLVMLLRRRTRSISTTSWVDGLIAGLAVSALSAAVVFETLNRHVEGDLLGVVVALAYPLTDTMLLVVIAVALAAMAWRIDRRWALLAIGVVSFWLADSLYAVTAVRGDHESGGWFDIGWWAGMLAISAAAWQPGRPRSRVPPDARRLIAVPLAFGSIGLALLLYATVVPVSRLSVALAAASLVAVMARTLLTFRDYVGMLAHSRQEALTDALTGLGNRRALERVVEGELSRADDDDQLILVLFDLDGFKHYNDNFGHPAGDALLVRLSAALATFLDGRGQAFRMGGDEFCALFRPGPSGVQMTLDGAAAALTEKGDGFLIGCSYGSVDLPGEARTPADALGVADQRMYADKRSRRSPVAEQLRTSSGMLSHTAIPSGAADRGRGAPRRANR